MNKISIVLAASLLSASIIFTGCERPKAGGMEAAPMGPLPVASEEVKAANLPATLEATGQTQAFNTVQIYSRVNGYLKKRNYTEGGRVSEGDTLFTIDPADLTNARDSAKASLMQAEASHENAKAVLNRIKPLVEANAASRQEYDNAVANERTTAAAVASAKALYAQAELNLGYTKIKSPVSGYVDKSKIDIGTFITAGANGLLTTVYQTDPMYVNFSFSENQRLAYQNALASGKLVAPKSGKYEVELTLGDGSVVNRVGDISFTAPFFDTTTGTMSYRATFKNSDNKLAPGQFVRVKVKGLEWKDSVSVPQKAVLTGEKGRFVYICEANNTVSARPVRIGEWIGKNVVVAEGLKAGEKIAVDGLSKLKPGAPITQTPSK
ncbi:MAG TPA: efflux RND transporter periplasmic adaptor subunit [Campylobacterales bacterium]|nr:efflux RND transporter periplasmic adaptor subunit [Campylobacterales bacterium]